MVEKKYTRGEIVCGLTIIALALAVKAAGLLGWVVIAVWTLRQLGLMP